MRKLYSILVCLIITLNAGAWGYEPMPTDFRSTSAYVPVQATPQPMRTQGFYAISTSNFETLNSEDGLCSEHSARNMRRGKKPDGPSIGDYDEESPIGEALIPLLLFLLSYVLIRRKKCS